MIEITRPTLSEKEIKKAIEKQKEKDIKTLESIEKKEKIVKKSKKIKKQKVIGKQNYINSATGEIIETLVVEKNIEQDFNFYKVWLLDLLNILELVGTKKMKVVNYIFENLNAQENLFIGTHEKVAKKLNISRPVVSQTFKILQDANLLIKINNGAYMLNPDIIIKGRTAKRLNLLIKYNNIKAEKSE